MMRYSVQTPSGGDNDDTSFHVAQKMIMTRPVMMVHAFILVLEPLRTSLAGQFVSCNHQLPVYILNLYAPSD